MFELPNNTECTLTKFVGRTQKSGKDDVPAVSFRLRLDSVRNELLDLVSKTMRLTVYEPIPGSEPELPGVEVTTPILRSKDLKHWAPEDLRCEGWQVIVARGIDDGGALQMGKCKLDDFRFDFYEGGHMDVDFRVSTADVDEAGAGMLWGRQERKVFIAAIAPEVPIPGDAPVIDGSTGAFERDHPDATDLFAGRDGPDDETEGEGSDTDADDDAPPAESKSTLSPEAAWPFPRSGRADGSAPPQSVTVETSRPGTRTARGREATQKALAAGAAKSPAKYRNKDTGDTWAGRGIMPKWLKVQMERGAKLSDFEVRA